MDHDLTQKNSWIETLKNTYKIVVLNEEDLKEIGSYTLSLRKIYLLVFVSIVLISAMVVSMILFTPIRSLIPGYGKIENDKAYQELFTNIQELENKLKAQDIYTIGLQNMLRGIEEGSGNPITDQKQSIESKDIIESEKTGLLNKFHLISPITGSISRAYDPQSEHYGVDILAPANSPVKTIQDGVVINASWSDEAGNMVYIQHPQNLISVYKHNSSVLVKAGQRVSAGQAVAIIGNTGTLSSGPHLHFELWYDGLPVNPSNYITF
jgi:murein DD-endopeptidase MepM/ murein hydrolase activator NlpD